MPKPRGSSSPTRLPSPMALEFLLQMQQDEEEGVVRSLRDYLELFPNHEETVAREYLSLSSEPVPVEEEERVAAPVDQASRYQRGEVIGEGGMGRVYLARDQRLERFVALKYGKGLMTSADASALMHEAVVAASLQHPNIPAVHDTGEDSSGRFYYVMDHIEGVDLREILDRRAQGDTTWSLNRLLALYQQACLAMSYAHSRGVVHLDLKPANIMTGQFGELYVVDWGLSGSGQSSRDGSKSKSGAKSDGKVIRGTPAYMSPEQASGAETLGAQSDVFSLGVILYEVVTAERAFRGGSSRELIRKVRDVQYERGGGWNEAPGALREICERILVRQPRRRPDPQWISDSIQEFLEGTREKARREEAAKKALKLAEKRLQKADERTRDHRADARDLETLRPEPWQSVSEKRRYWKLEDRSRGALDDARHEVEEATMLLLEAHRNDPDNAEVRQRLGARYWEEFLSAELRRDSFAQRFYEQQLKQLSLAEYDKLLTGSGSLHIECLPSAQHMEIRPLLERDRIRRPGQPQAVAGKSLCVEELNSGAWQVKLERRGYRGIVAPVFVGRNEKVRLSWHFRKEGEVGAGFIQVPAGTFTMGGDETTVGSVARRRVTVREFCIAEYPVTIAEYFEFLQDIHRVSPKRARQRVPRTSAGGEPYDWVRTDPLELEVYRGKWQHRRWPVFGVSWHDAMAYARWRSQKDGRRYSLPSDEEWEKAARGNDRRIFPWGDTYDAVFCKNLQSRSIRSQPEPVGAFKRDVSPYGVRDMAGGIKDWCRSWFSKTDKQRLVRGGSWNHTPVGAHCAYRNGCPPNTVHAFIGIRLVHHYRSVP